MLVRDVLITECAENLSTSQPYCKKVSGDPHGRAGEGSELQVTRASSGDGGWGGGKPG